jgi:hypothetical protein
MLLHSDCRHSPAGQSDGQRGPVPAGRPSPGGPAFGRDARSVTMYTPQRKELADRLVVFRDGRLHHGLFGSELTEQRVDRAESSRDGRR